jgi:hypothetical protein
MWVDLGELVERLIISISPHFRDGGGHYEGIAGDNFSQRGVCGVLGYL